MEPYFRYFVFGFLSGNIMYSYYLPKCFKGVDVVALSDDGNPGTANAVKLAGVGLGMLCLALDICKGVVPVMLAARSLERGSLLFSIVIAAPVLGHAFSPLMLGRGGKAIATSFGALLGLMPWNLAAALLAGLYILFSSVFQVNPHRKRTILVFALFGAAAIPLNPPPVALGCALISLTVIYRNVRARA